MMYVIEEKDMSEWEQICKALAKKIGATLLFVNDTGMGIEDANGNLRHIYIDELMDMLRG